MDTEPADTPRTPVALVQAAFARFAEDDVIRISAAMSYFLLMAIVPVLLFANMALGLIGDRLGGGPLADTIHQAAAVAAPVYSQVAAWAGSWAPYVTLGLIVFGAASVFGQFVGALQVIWHTPAEKNPVRGFLIHNGLSFALLALVAIVLLVAVIAGGVMSVLGGKLLSVLARAGVSVPAAWLATAIRYAVVYVVAALLFEVAFTVVPKRRIRWQDVVPGALITAALFLVGEGALSIFLGTKQSFTVFGAFQFFVVLIVWIYYSSLVVLWGAELTKLLVEAAESRRQEQPASA